MGWRRAVRLRQGRGGGLNVEEGGPVMSAMKATADAWHVGNEHVEMTGKRMSETSPGPG